nr:DUF3224 domain-containing protein [Streptomyces sp. FB2]
MAWAHPLRGNVRRHPSSGSACQTEGSVQGREGAFNIVHSATTSGSDRTAEFFTIVPSSGAGDLAAITGAGGLAVDADGTHRICFDHDLG